MNFLKEQGGRFRSFWRGGYSAEVWRSAVAFLILAVVGFLACFFFHDLLDYVMGLVTSVFNSLDITDSSGNLSALALFLNNLRACAVAIVYGFIPFLYLSSLVLGMNSLLLGVLAAYYVVNGQSLLLYLAAMLPHGIFELPALVLSFALGLYLCGQITRRLKNDAGAMSIPLCLENAGRVYLMFIVPLLAAAAVAEAYLTPRIAGLFL